VAEATSAAAAEVSALIASYIDGGMCDEDLCAALGRATAAGEDYLTEFVCGPFAGYA
jgi:hypothetical protein